MLGAFFEFVVVVARSLKLFDECSMDVAEFAFNVILAVVAVFAVLLRYFNIFLPPSAGASLIGYLISEC